MIKGRDKAGMALILFMLLFLLSCDNRIVFTDSSAIPYKTWRLPDIASFSFPVNDTLSSNNIHFTIRTGTSYPYRNIYLFVSTISPDGKTITDTLQYDLADEKGNWYGKGFGDVHELNLPYRSNVYFPVKGIYTLKVQHGMRMEDLKGVYDFGMRIEKTRK